MIKIIDNDDLDLDNEVDLLPGSALIKTSALPAMKCKLKKIPATIISQSSSCNHHDNDHHQVPQASKAFLSCEETTCLPVVWHLGNSQGGSCKCFTLVWVCVVVC